MTWTDTHAEYVADSVQDYMVTYHRAALTALALAPDATPAQRTATMLDWLVTHRDETLSQWLCSIREPMDDLEMTAAEMAPDQALLAAIETALDRADGGP
jgi:hypothetical protein